MKAGQLRRCEMEFHHFSTARFADLFAQLVTSFTAGLLSRRHMLARPPVLLPQGEEPRIGLAHSVHQVRLRATVTTAPTGRWALASRGVGVFERHENPHLPTGLKTGWDVSERSA